MMRILSVTLLIFTISCVKRGARLADSKPNAESSSHFKFKKNPTESVLKSGGKGLPILVSDPYIHVENNDFHLFFGTFFCKKNGTYQIMWDPGNPSNCLISENVFSIGYAYSSDEGLTWNLRQTPVLANPTADWENGKTETPSVLVSGAKMTLFYSVTNKKLGQRYRLGAITHKLEGSLRDEMLNSSKQIARGGSSSPLIDFDMANGSFKNNVQEPSAVFEDGKIILYFVGLSLSKPGQSIDSDNEVLGIRLFRAKLEEDLSILEISQPIDLPVNIIEVKKYADRYYLFSTSFRDSDGPMHKNEKIELFTSTDGRSWQTNGIIIEPSNGFDSWGLMAPTVHFGKDKIIVFYTGWEVQNNECFPVPSDGRFGIPVAQGKCAYANLGRAEATLSHSL